MRKEFFRHYISKRTAIFFVIITFSYANYCCGAQDNALREEEIDDQTRLVLYENYLEEIALQHIPRLIGKPSRPYSFEEIIDYLASVLSDSLVTPENNITLCAGF